MAHRVTSTTQQQTASQDTSVLETKRNDNASQVEPTPAATTPPTGLITRTVAKTATTGATPLSDYVFLLVL
jgi:hypothetical protein